MPRCDHLALRVHDLEKSVRFYEQILPGRVIARRDAQDRWRTRIAWIEPAGQPGFAVVLIQPTRIRWLLRLFHAVVPRQCRSFEHVGFACASRAEVDARAATARELCFPLLVPPTQVDAKVGYVCEVLDPDQNPVEWTHGQTFG